MDALALTDASSVHARDRNAAVDALERVRAVAAVQLASVPAVLAPTAFAGVWDDGPCQPETQACCASLHPANNHTSTSPAHGNDDVVLSDTLQQGTKDVVPTMDKKARDLSTKHMHGSIHTAPAVITPIDCSAAVHTVAAGYQKVVRQLQRRGEHAHMVLALNEVSTTGRS